MPEGKIELSRAQRVAEAVVEQLRPYCQRIEIAGSIRRKKHWVNDIDLVLIPKDQWNLHAVLTNLGDGKLMMSGPKIVRVLYGSIQVDIYLADETTWATLLLIRTGSAENNIRLATLAKKRGWRLAASGDGLFNMKGERIAGDTEESIYAALGLPWQPPERRG
ncbi:DNA polymerase/3'-5' exonuclease PolX [subsurface metagenome]